MFNNKRKISPEMENCDLDCHIEKIEKGIHTSANKVGKQVNKFYNGWRKFAFKDDIINVAVGMIIATSFKNVVNSLVVDIIMPILIGLGAENNANNLFIVLVPSKKTNATYHTLDEAKRNGAVTWNYGSFLTVFLDLIFVSIFLYIILKVVHRIQHDFKELVDKELEK
jgi:large conductance mechanosensitive channel